MLRVELQLGVGVCGLWQVAAWAGCASVWSDAALKGSLCVGAHRVTGSTCGRRSANLAMHLRNWHKIYERLN